VFYSARNDKDDYVDRWLE